MKRAGEKIADTAKGAAGKIHDTFAANEAVKQLVKAVNDAKKKGANPQLFVKAPKGEFALTAVTLSKNKKALILTISDAASKGITIEKVQEILANNGITKKITNAIDSIQIGVTDNMINRFPEGFSEKAEDIEKNSFNVAKAKIEDIKFDGSNEITFKLGETRAEQHDKEDNDLWS